MKKSALLFVIACLLSVSSIRAQDAKEFTVQSPNSQITLNVQVGDQVQWSVVDQRQHIITPSTIGLELGDGSVLGKEAKVVDSNTVEVDSSFKAINYKKAVVPDHYRQLTLRFEGDYGLNFRVYDDAVAYRFFTRREGQLTIRNEIANFNFDQDYEAMMPYMWDYRADSLFNSSFEALYDHQKISEFRPDSLAMLPALVDVGHGRKAVILEADLEDYPGMYLDLNRTKQGYKGVYAPYPLETAHVNLNLIPTKRADYIARTEGSRTFPWRVVAISEHDTDLLNNDIVQKLASKPRIEDTSWIEAGQSAWEWWNNWNISGVDFRAGQNTKTYKYYIDFAADNGQKYVVMDAGWNTPGDLTQTIDDIDLPELIRYGKERGVNLILWASWYDILQQGEQAFEKYSKMGIKGFKIDFFDRDDQKAVASTYDIARKAARHHLVVDYHGVFKPTGLQRTWPNVVGYEGVMGLEWSKWSAYNVPRYTVTIPFIRMMAGPMDYTPGAMRNATRRHFRSIETKPMSQGTRCQQLAMYVVYDAPFPMLADSPTMYQQEQESTDFISSIPVTFDQTVPLAGEVSQYVALAKRKGTTWYVGAMTNWTARTLTLDLSFLQPGKTYRAVIFKDGINADRDATDYMREVREISAGDSLEVQLSEGGGWAARLEIVN